MKWPDHLALELTHNDHKTYYKSVVDAIGGDDVGYEDDDWVSDEQRDKAIATNECWTLRWYPSTPVGFCAKSAADLDALMEWMEA